MTWAQDTLDAIAALSPSQRSLRAASIVAPQVAVATTAAAGDASVVLTGALFLLSLVAALRPDSHAPFLVTALVALHWVVGVDEIGSPWVLVTAAAVLVLHVATAAATAAPPAAQLPASALRRWLLRCAAALAITAAAWGAMRLLASLDTRANVALAVAGCAAAAGMIGLVWPRERV
jgi:hypothetical protein